MANVPFMDPKLIFRAADLANGTYRPQAIIDLKAEIDGETRALEVSASITGVVDQSRVEAIVRMKLQLDGLYVDWVEGRIF